MAPITPRVKVLRARYHPAMCMFSRRVEHVSATKIFAGDQPDGRQALIYSMTVTTGEPLAMVLPLPVPADGPDDAVEFVNLEGYSDLFDDLKRAFPDQMIYAQPLGRSRGPAANAHTLVVHAVGAFVASYVPHARDFSRLDKRFRLPSSVLDALPQYGDWGFAVFQLDKTKQKAIHPMAMRFPRRDPGSIFFPLTHVHDGKLPASASFDHALYGQLPPLIATLADWTSSHRELGTYVDATRAKGLIDPAQRGQVHALLGPGPNQDLWLRPPANVAVEDLAGAGTHFTFRVSARYLYAAESHPTYPRWRETSVTKLAALCRGIREGLTELTARNARAWQLGTSSPRLMPYFMNGDQLWSGTDYMTGKWAQEPQGPGAIAFRPFSDSVEQQDITLAFDTLPDQNDARQINRALCELLERIARDA